MFKYFNLNKKCINELLNVQLEFKNNQLVNQKPALQIFVCLEKKS